MGSRRRRDARYAGTAGLADRIGQHLVRNEDVFVEQAIRNVAEFCDVIHVVDHVSDDRTSKIVRALAGEFDHIDARRSRNSAVAHRLLEPYSGTSTWVLGVDGDELYDPAGLARLRIDLELGALTPTPSGSRHMSSTVTTEPRRGHGVGLATPPPARPVTKLFNFDAIESWRGSVTHSRAARSSSAGLLVGDAMRSREGYELEYRPLAVCCTSASCVGRAESR